MTEVPEGGRATANFRRQHTDLVKLAGEIMSGLDTEKCETLRTAVRDKLARFAGKLKAHTVMEEQ